MMKSARARLAETTILALLWSTGAATAAAQQPGAGAEADAPSGEPFEEIVITGIRQSLDKARSIKRDTVQIVDAIVAEDIGKLPDTNVAESLSRVSGVQVDRGIAAGTNISIRGLRENVILYNGREVFDAAGRGGIGLDQTQTSTYGLLALVPAELISRLEVTKLATADQVAGAIGGIVDIVSRRPFDAAGTQVAASAGTSYEDLPEDSGLELFGLFSTSNADQSLGFLASVTYSERDLAEQGLNTISGYGSFVEGGVTRFALTDFRAQQIAETRESLGLSAVLQWAPSDAFLLTADVFYSELEADRDRHWLAFNPTAGLSNAEFSPNDILLAGTASTGMNTNVEFQDNSSELVTSAVRAEFTVSPTIEASAELSVGNSSADLDRQFVRLATTGVSPVVDFDLRSGSFGSADVSGVDFTDPAQLTFAILFDDLFRAETDDVQLSTDWTFDVAGDTLKSVRVGARHLDMETDQDPLRADIRPGLPAGNFVPEFIDVFSNPDFLPGAFSGLPRSFLAALETVEAGCNGFSGFPTISQHPQCLDRTISPNSIGSTFGIEEAFTSAYAMLNFETVLGGSDASASLGLRYVQRDLESTGNLIAPDGSVSEVVFERDDGELLPSAIARVSVSENLVARIGAAKVLSFPKTEDLNNGVILFNNAVFDQNGNQISPGTGRGGAPGLNPFEANQYDLSLEYYFGDTALIAAGLFYKDISTFIIQEQSAEVFGGVNFLISRKVNGNEASVQGIELLYQQPFTFLPAPFDGLGVMATYSYIDSETPITDVNGRNLTFPGLSENNVNLVGYYEKGPFSARIAYNWRDEYLLTLNSVTNTGVFNDSYSDLSAFVGYDINDNIVVELEGANLTDSDQTTFDGVPEALRTNVVFGRIYKASVRIRF